MELVLGLGNPGERYARTRHNVGWQVLDELIRRWEARATERTEEYRAWEAERSGAAVMLVAPITYMNRSGDALRSWRGRHGDPTRLLVIVDDVYLPVGYLRLRASGRSGGHRGLESIETELGHHDYARLRVGIGAAKAPELGQHVLDEPGPEEAGALEDAVRRAADAVESWLAEGLVAAMNRYNRRVTKEVSES